MDYLTAFNAWITKQEQEHDPMAIARWSREYGDVPFYLIAAYLAMVFWGQSWMANRSAFNLKPFFIVWNLLLAAFSIKGAVVLVPYMIRQISAHGFRWTVCHNSLEWWNLGAEGFWFALFTFSKVPELMDTVFLVFQKKPVIFLHWYHHTTVMLYCWFGFATFHSVGAYFGAMNYFVHAIMYSYYFMMSVSGVTRNLVKPIAPLITILQIAQMIAGLVFIVIAHVYANDAEGCAGNQPTIIRAALVMYASYFVLFAKFFLDSYVFKKKKAAGPTASKPKAQ